MNPTDLETHVKRFLKGLDNKELNTISDIENHFLKLLFMNYDNDIKSNSTIMSTIDHMDTDLTNTIADINSNQIDQHNILTKNSHPSKLLEYLSNLSPRQVCQYQFKTNDIVWICKQCQKVYHI